MDECMICGRSKAEHDYPGIHHLFSEHGELKAKEKPRAARVTVQPADTLLRLITLLRSKGVLDKNDLDVIFGGVSDLGRSESDGEDHSTGACKVPS